MEEKRYLKWYNKVGYGSGDIAGNVVYAFLSSFVMIYLTNTVGLNPGIVGTLIAASKFFDGMTDVFFGAMIDKTKSRLGKARPWMLYAYIGCAVTLAAIFMIPVDLGKTAQYAWFFIAYTLLNAVFYTANNIAYSALTALVTKNSKERVQMGSYRFIFAFATSLLIQSVTIGAVSAFGGGAAGWRTVAILYAVIGLAVNTISVLSVRELPQNELNDSASGEYQNTTEKYGLIAAAKLLISNKFYLMICGVYILQQIYTAMINMGIYYMTYVLKNENLFGVFSWAVNIPLIIALVFTPTLVAKWKGMYKLNLRGYMLGTAGRALVVVAGYIGSVPLMLLFTAVAALGQGPWQGDMNAVIASCSEYTYLTKNKRVDGTMYSCTSLGIKLGGGLGTAVAGWMLAASGFDGAAAVQPESCIRMLCFMYLWVPVIISFIITFVLSKMNVEQTNAELRKKRSGEFLWSDIDTKM
ncbi:MAG: glycoside-pentoside-hexuronide (GPH):cation symporter [Lachnospiraceae bacterium]|nr:MFS transporter [Lachnospiraceae bacterium]